MAIQRFVLATKGPKEDPAEKRIKSLEDQIKQATEQLKLAKETDSKSDRVFNLQQRVNTLKTQKDKLKKRTTDKKDHEKKSKGEKASKTCAKHGKLDCQSTMCPESPNYNVLTQI